jgi:hypothetical protein
MARATSWAAHDELVLSGDADALVTHSGRDYAAAQFLPASLSVLSPGAFVNRHLRRLRPPSAGMATANNAAWLNSPAASPPASTDGWIPWPTPPLLGRMRGRPFERRQRGATCSAPGDRWTGWTGSTAERPEHPAAWPTAAVGPAHQLPVDQGVASTSVSGTSQVLTTSNRPRLRVRGNATRSVSSPRMDSFNRFGRGSGTPLPGRSSAPPAPARPVPPGRAAGNDRVRT